MGGMVMGGTISEIARNALSQDKVPSEAPPKDVSGIAPAKGVNSLGGGQGFNVGAFLNKSQETPTDNVSKMQPTGEQKKFCSNCGAALEPGMKFCSQCGTPVVTTPKCPVCGTEYKAGAKFCVECGAHL